MGARVKRLDVTEDDVQRVIVEGLRALGYLVTVISRRRKKCWSCGKWPRGGDGVGRGAPDLIVRHETWPRGVTLSLEVKKPGKVKWSSVEQRLAAEEGHTWVVQSLEDARTAVRCIEHALYCGCNVC